MSNSIIVGIKVDSSQAATGFKQLNDEAIKSSKTMSESFKSVGEQTKKMLTDTTNLFKDMFTTIDNGAKQFMKFENSIKRVLGLFVGRPLANLFVDLGKITLLITGFKLLKGAIGTVKDALVNIVTSFKGFEATTNGIFGPLINKLGKLAFQIGKAFGNNLASGITEKEVAIFMALVKPFNNAAKALNIPINSMTKTLEGYKSKLGLLINPMEAINRVTKKTEDSFDKYTKKIIDNGKAYVKNNAEAKIFVEGSKMIFNSATGLVGKFNSITDAAKKIGGPLGNATSKLLEFINKIGGLKTLVIAGAALTAGFVAISKAAKFTSDNLKRIVDEGSNINDMSSRMGLTTNTYQKLSAMAGLAGVSIETLSVANKKLTMNAYEAANGNKDLAKYFNILDIKVRNANGSMKSQEQLLRETMISLAEMPASTERQVIAQKLLGKSADELAPIFNEGAKAVEQYFNKGESAITMSTDLVKASDSIGDNFFILQQTGKKMLNTFFEPLMIYLDDLFKKMIVSSGGTDKFNEKLMNLGKSFVDVVNTGVNFVEMLVDTGKALNDNKTLVLVLSGLLGTYAIATNAAAVGTGLLTIATNIAAGATKAWNLVLSMNPLGAVFLAVTALTAGIYAYSDAVDKALEKQSKFFNAEANQVQDVILKVKELNSLRGGLKGTILSPEESKRIKQLEKDIKGLTGQTAKWNDELQEYQLWSGDAGVIGSIFDAKGAATSLAQLEKQLYAANILAEKAAKEAAETAANIDAAEGAQATADKKAAAAKARADEIKAQLEADKKAAADRLKQGLDLAKQYEEAVLSQTSQGRILLLERQANDEIELLKKSGMSKVQISEAINNIITISDKKKTEELKSEVDKQGDIWKSFISEVQKAMDERTRKEKAQQDVRIGLMSEGVKKQIALEKQAHDERVNAMKDAFPSKTPLDKDYMKSEQERNKLLEELEKQHQDNIAKIKSDSANQVLKANFDMAMQMKDQLVAGFDSINQIATNKQKKALENTKKVDSEVLDGLNVTNTKKEQITKQNQVKQEKMQDEIDNKNKAWQVAQIHISAASSIGQMWMGVIADGSKAGIPGVISATAFASIMSALMGGVATAQSAAVMSAANGGIVPGNSYSGDKLQANVNSGEMILNKRDQSNLFKSIKTGGIGGSGQTIINHSIVVQGNITEDKMNNMREEENKFIKNLENGLRTLKSSGRLKFA